MKLYIITGASRGLGQAVYNLLKEKNDVVDISRSSKEFPCDFAKSDSVEGTIDKVLQKYSLENYEQVMLINNAGIVKPVSLLGNLSSAEIQSNININLVAPFILVNDLLKAAEGYQGNIKVVNVTSGAAQRPVSSWSAYSASKAAIDNFSECLNEELGDRGQAYCFNPGLIDTDMQKNIRDASADDFSEVERFREFEKQGHLVPPKQVAQRLLKEVGEL